MHQTTVYEKGGHYFEREKGVLYGRTWKEEKEEGNDVIILQTHN